MLDPVDEVSANLKVMLFDGSLHKDTTMFVDKQ